MSENEYYEWINKYYEWINEWSSEYYEWSSEYYELPDEFGKYYERQDGVCKNYYPELMSSVMEESKITVFFLKTTFGKSLFVVITFTCTFS